jgi:hypothetical protein
MVHTLPKILCGSSGPKRWQNSHFQGEADAYGKEVTPLNIFESQIILANIFNFKALLTKFGYYCYARNSDF